MTAESALVSVGLPVRNGGDGLLEVVGSVLGQDHADLELVICDNASTDNTEEVCRDLASRDERITYRRHPENIGILNNFIYAIRAASGDYFRWIGDDDRLEPRYVSRTLAEFRRDPHRLLVTTQISYQDPHGEVRTETEYDPAPLASDDPVDRLAGMLALLNMSYLLVDPLYALMRRSTVAAIPRRNMLREDQVFATKLALAGPWGHVPEVLAHRHTKPVTRRSVARLLDAPAWHARFANTLQFSETLRWVDRAGLSPAQRHAARALVRRAFVQRQAVIARQRARRVASWVGSAAARGTGRAGATSA